MPLITTHALEKNKGCKYFSRAQRGKRLITGAKLDSFVRGVYIQSIHFHLKLKTPGTVWGWPRLSQVCGVLAFISAQRAKLEYQRGHEQRERTGLRDLTRLIRKKAMDLSTLLYGDFFTKTTHTMPWLILNLSESLRPQVKMFLLWIFLFIYFFFC